MPPSARQSFGPLDPTVAQARTLVRDALAPILPAQAADDAPNAASDLATAPLILVACSGGPDSMALAATAAFVIPRLGARVGAVIVDHDLQPGSAAAAQQAAQQCRDLGLEPVEVIKTQVARGPESGGLEAGARSARYAVLRQQTKKHRAQAVLLGHTLDDQAEQVLLALTRGSGTRSLAGIPAQRDFFYRPFLQLRRRDTEHICAHLKLTTWLDPTNELPAETLTHQAPSLINVPRRTVVRNIVLPHLEHHLGPGIAQALARTAGLARADDAALSDLADNLLHEATTNVTAQERQLDCHVLGGAPKAVRTRALRRACIAIGVPTSPLALVHVTALDDLVTNWRGQGPVDLPGGHQGRRQYGTLTLYTVKK